MASSYGYIKKGASGDTVSWIQQQLGINADGKFGSQTEKAVRDFQKANGIQVDGIVGNETMEYLLNRQGNTSNVNVNPNWLAQNESNRPSYAPSQALNDAAAMLARQEQNRPGDYQSKYGDQIQKLLDQILNREDFSYDFNADPLYHQYADQYQNKGQMAMMDAMGNAAALTGGYGSSYAQTVGQQAYQGYLQELNNIIPELRNAAYQEYQDAGNKMLSDIGLLQGLDESDYGRYRDDVSDYYNDLNYYYNKYNDMSDTEYNRYLHDVDSWEKDRAYWYGKEQDALSQSNWEREFSQAQSNWEKEFALAASKAKGSGAKSETVPYGDIVEYMKYLHEGGANQQELINALYGIPNNIDSDSYENAMRLIASFPTLPSVPQNTKDYDLLTKEAFNRNALLKEKYGTYANYVRSVAGK